MTKLLLTLILLIWQSAPSNLTAVAYPAGYPPLTASSKPYAVLSWQDNSTNEEGFKIQRCAGIGCTNFISWTQVGRDVRTYTNTQLTPGVTYRYRVCAVARDATCSAYSNIAEATTP